MDETTLTWTDEQEEYEEWAIWSQGDTYSDVASLDELALVLVYEHDAHAYCADMIPNDNGWFDVWFAPAPDNYVEW